MNKIEYYAIHSRVLVVAVHRIDGWAAYATPVPGADHRAEAPLWQSEGEKLSAKQAAVFFPHLDVNHYAH